MRVAGHYEEPLNNSRTPLHTPHATRDAATLSSPVTLSPARRANELLTAQMDRQRLGAVHGRQRECECATGLRHASLCAIIGLKHERVPGLHEHYTGEGHERGAPAAHNAQLAPVPVEPKQHLRDRGWLPRLQGPQLHTGVLGPRLVL